MNTLGYVNINWLREFLDWAQGRANMWLESQNSYIYNWAELDFFDEYRFVNQININLFYYQGLSPEFIELNTFQQYLVLDALAVAICADEPQIWVSEINQRKVSVYNRQLTLSDQPKTLFQYFYDLLSESLAHSLSEFTHTSWCDDANDNLSLYKYC